MKVKLKHSWFAPTGKDPRLIDNGKVKQTTSGARYRAGEVDIPDSLIKFLPSTAVILDKEAEKPVEKKEHSFKDFDELRPAQDKMAAVRAAKGR